MPTIEPRLQQPICWSRIATVLLDMDGTLLDKYFDDYFWLHYVPQVFAETNGLDFQKSQTTLFMRYQAVENTLQWTDLDFWSEQLGLDIPELKTRIDHLVEVLPHVSEFLWFLSAQGKKICLVTAAHHKTLRIKLRKTDLEPRFDRIICAEDIGLPKESPDFWSKLERHLGFDRRQTMLADDTAKVLHAARRHGISHLIHVARPSLHGLASYDSDFLSIASFNELMP